MKHDSQLFFRDDYAIGQAAVARIQKEVSGDMCLKSAQCLLDPTYWPAAVREMHGRLLAENLRVYRRATQVQEFLA